MRKKENFLLAFVVFLVLSFIVFGLSKTGILDPVEAISQKILSPFQLATYNIFNNLSFLGENAKIKKLESENMILTSMLYSQTKLQKENSALSDQFRTVYPKSYSLIPANIVGAPTFIPGVSLPETFIVDEGESNGVKVGDAVVYKNNLVGRVTKINSYLSEVTLLTNASSSFTARTSTSQSLGVIKGQGEGQMILDNVLLSSTLKTDELVLTNGDTGLNTGGYPPGLVVGKIVSVDKNPSSLFQKADVESFLDFSSLTTVFIFAQ